MQADLCLRWVHMSDSTLPDVAVPMFWQVHWNNYYGHAEKDTTEEKPDGFMIK